MKKAGADPGLEALGCSKAGHGMKPKTRSPIKVNAAQNTKVFSERVSPMNDLL